MRTRFALIATALAAVFSLAHAHDYRAGSVHVLHPWARSTPTVVGGYMKIENEGDTADRLISARSDAAKSVQLHTHEVDANGVARMREVDGVDLAAHQSVEFRPGSLHVMFVGLKRPVKDGEMVPATLRFEKAGEVQVQFKVENARTDNSGAGASAAGQHQH